MKDIKNFADEVSNMSKEDLEKLQKAVIETNPTADIERPIEW